MHIRTMRTMAVVLMLIGASAVLASSVAAAGTDLQNVARDKWPALAPSVKTKLLTLPTRAMMVKSLLANPATKSVILQSLKASGISDDQADALATTPICKMKPSVSTAVTQVPNAAAIEYNKLDWSAGLTFTPYSVPTYSNYHVGDIEVIYGRILTSQQDVLYLELPSPDINDNIVRSFLWLDLLLPEGKNTYMIALKMLKRDGTCPESLIGLGSSGNNSPITAILYYRLNKNVEAVLGIAFTPLADGSGYVGIFSVDVGGVMAPSIHSTMAARNACFSLNYRCSSPFADRMRNLIFRSITITKL